MGKGNYELVDNPKFDIESGMASPEDDVIFPTTHSSTSDTEPFKDRFDRLADGDSHIVGLKQRIRRNKRLFIVLTIITMFWVVGIVVYATGGHSTLIDYYKSKVTSSEAAEAEGENHDPIPTVESKPEPPLAPEVENQRPQTSPESVISEKKPVTMDDIRGGQFYVYETNLKFIQPATTKENFLDEGLYYFADRDGFHVKKASDPNFDVKLNRQYAFYYGDEQLRISTLVPNYDLTYAIVSTNRERVFRHSSTAEYWLYDIKDERFEPITGEHSDRLSYARWSPNFNYITIVKDNDIYIKSLKDGSFKRITNDGSDLTLNGKTDWVYEEEVMAVDQALWWSPDESSFIFMKTDETDVPTYNIDYYVQTKEGGATKYPMSQKIVYPKPGFPNPLVSLHAYDIATDVTVSIDRTGSHLGDEFVIYEVFYIDSKNVVIKETDRESNVLNFRHYDTETQQSKITYEVDAVKEYNGWIEKLITPLVIPPGSGRENYGFIDMLVINGYNHLVLFESADSNTPIALTNGQWEVANAELSYDARNNRVFFSSNERSSIARHVYSVHLETTEIQAFIDADNTGYYNSHFSPSGKYVSLKYEGPEVPDQSLYATDRNESPITTLSDTTYLKLSLSKYAIPTKTYHRIEVDTNEDGTPVELNVIEILPANFDKAKKHPLLVHYYAGPGSQVVTSSFGVDFEESVASSLGAVVLYIEPRGTGGQGWKFRSWSRKKIGYWEPRDIVTVAKKWISENDFIDASKTAVWGWSYGGFTTLKTLEYDAGEVFKYGMAVAPVTNWLLYDSIYTERYMDTPDANEEGYKISQISNVENLSKAQRFLIMHGTADDNVHIQNTYSLLDLLDIGGVENYDVHVFPDSEHSIYYHNANPIVYDKLSSWLKDAFDGDFETLGHK